MHNTLRFILACLGGIVVPLVTMADNPSDPATVRAGLSRYVAPQFPVMALDRGLFSGSAAVAVAWDETGNPTDVVLLRNSHPLFGEAVQVAARDWRHPPGPETKQVDLFEVKFAASGVVMSSAADQVARLGQSQPTEPLRLLAEEELDAPLKAVAQPMPGYPRSLAGKGADATVVVGFLIDEEGRVRAATVREATAPEFAREALNAMQNWRYEPPRKNGRPAVTTATWSFQFSRNS